MWNGYPHGHVSGPPARCSRYCCGPGRPSYCRSRVKVTRPTATTVADDYHPVRYGMPSLWYLLRVPMLFLVGFVLSVQLRSDTPSAPNAYCGLLCLRLHRVDGGVDDLQAKTASTICRLPGYRYSTPH